MVYYRKNLILNILIILTIISFGQTVKSHFIKGDPGHGEETRKLNQAIRDVYEGCGFIKTCVKICSSAQIGCDTCISTHSCYALVTLEHKDNKYHIKMFRQLTENLDFIAFGISDDNTMGKDAIFACVSSSIGSEKNRNQNHFAAYSTNNGGLKNLVYDNVPQNTYSVPKHTVIESHYLCEFSIKSKFQVRNLKVDLDKGKYSMIAAIGEASSAWELAGHSKTNSGRVVTEKFDWKDVPVIDDYDESYDKGNSQQISIYTLCVLMFVVVFIV